MTRAPVLKRRGPRLGINAPTELADWPNADFSNRFALDLFRTFVTDVPSRIQGKSERLKRTILLEHRSFCPTLGTKRALLLRLSLNEAGDSPSSY